MDIKLSCPECGSMSIAFPQHDDEQVICSDCRAELGTKRSADEMIKKSIQKAGDDFLSRNAPQSGPWSMKK